MPYLQILWRSERLTQETIIRTRDDLARAVGEVLSAIDAEHLVNEAMVDARVQEIGPLDRIRSDLFVTVCARYEIVRAESTERIVAALAAVAREASGVDDAVVELVLTSHSSSVDYESLE